MGVNHITARKRFQRLIDEKVIIGFRPMINVGKLGYEYYKVDMWLNDYSKMDKIGKYIAQLPNVTYSQKTLIYGDVEFDIEAPSFMGFVRIIDGIKKKFPSDIADYTYYSRIEECKTDYFPKI
jgi:DNA-binding Lrp family transcriptional regulator